MGRQRRAPQGARGLKFGTTPEALRSDAKSRPARGAWVEMRPQPMQTSEPVSVAPRKGRVG